MTAFRRGSHDLRRCPRAARLRGVDAFDEQPQRKRQLGDEDRDQERDVRYVYVGDDEQQKAVDDVAGAGDLYQQAKNPRQQTGVTDQVADRE